MGDMDPTLEPGQRNAENKKKIIPKNGFHAVYSQS